MNQTAHDTDILDAVEAYRAACSAAREVNREYRAQGRARADKKTALDEKRTATFALANATFVALNCLAGGISNREWQDIVLGSANRPPKGPA